MLRGMKVDQTCGDLQLVGNLRNIKNNEGVVGNEAREARERKVLKNIVLPVKGLGLFWQ